LDAEDALTVARFGVFLEELVARTLVVRALAVDLARVCPLAAPAAATGTADTETATAMTTVASHRVMLENCRFANDLPRVSCWGTPAGLGAPALIQVSAL
jgi:hypothetical protein